MNVTRSAVEATELSAASSGGISTPCSTSSAKAGHGEGAESRLELTMELGGLEPPTSWVRCGSLEPPPRPILGLIKAYSCGYRADSRSEIAVDIRGYRRIWALEPTWCPNAGATVAHDAGSAFSRELVRYPG